MPVTFFKKTPYRVLILLGVALLVVLYWMIGMQTLSAAFSYGDEGLVAEGARRIWQGEVPYRDFFSGVTPGSYYFYALLFKLLGPTFLTLRLGVVLTFVLEFAGCWWLLYRLGMRQLLPYVLVAVYLPYYGGGGWYLASYHWLVLVLCLFSLGLLLPRADGEFRRWSYLASGGLATLAAFTLQHKGVIWMLVATVALLFLPAGQRRRAVTWFWGGVLAVALPLVSGFVAVVGWDHLVDDLIVFPLSQYHNLAMHRGNLLVTLQKNWAGAKSAWLYRDNLSDWARIYAWNVGYLGCLVVYLLPFAAAFSLVSLWRRCQASRPQLVLLGAFAVASYLGAMHRLSDSTLLFAAPSAVLIVILYLQSNRGEPGTAVTPGLKLERGLVCGWLILFGTVSFAYGVINGASPRVTTHTPAGAVDSLLSGEAQTMAGVVDYLGKHRQPGEKIFCYSYHAMFYFLLQMDNPTPYDLLTYPMNTQAQLDDAQARLEADQTRWLLWGNNVPESSLNAYLRANYIVRARFKYADLLERRQ